MSDGLDMPTAQKDPCIDVCDVYLLASSSGTRAMVMKADPDAGPSAPDHISDGGLYSFCFDLDSGQREATSPAWVVR